MQLNVGKKYSRSLFQVMAFVEFGIINTLYRKKQSKIIGKIRFLKVFCMNNSSVPKQNPTIDLPEVSSTHLFFDDETRIFSDEEPTEMIIHTSSPQIPQNPFRTQLIDPCRRIRSPASIYIKTGGEVQFSNRRDD